MGWICRIWCIMGAVSELGEWWWYCIVWWEYGDECVAWKQKGAWWPEQTFGPPQVWAARPKTPSVSYSILKTVGYKKFMISLKGRQLILKCSVFKMKAPKIFLSQMTGTNRLYWTMIAFQAYSRIVWLLWYINIHACDIWFGSKYELRHPPNMRRG